MTTGQQLKQFPIFEQLYDRPFAHCATLMELQNGDLMAAWMSGSYETARDVAILASTLAPGAGAWTEPRVIAEVADHSLGQPVLLPRPDGELWLFFDVIMDTDWRSAVPYLQKSADGGVTWEPAERLFDYPGLMFRNRVLELTDRIIVPAYDENTWQSRMMISDDRGATWRLTEPLVTPTGNIHPSLVERADGTLLCYLRTGGKGGVIWRTTSTDRGETWAALEATELPNPNSGIDLLCLNDGQLVLAFNNSASLRTPLCVAIAGEDENWRCIKPVATEHYEFSYPTLIQRRDGSIHLVYTSKREHIHYAQFDTNWLQEGC